MNKLFNPLQMIQRSACGGIDIGADYDCDAPIAAGVNQRLILIDKEVFDRAVVTFDATLTTLITDIVLTEVGDAGFAFQGIRRSLNPQSAFVPATVSVGYDHQVDFQIFDISQAQKDNIEKLGLSKVVAIVENVNAPGNADSVFEVFGKDAGLEMQAGEMRINADNETNGSYTISLKTSDESGKEPKLPTSWWDTDYATTRPKVDALLVPVT
jgi:hypothetical protein